jgi:hypothetical protein
MLRRPVTLVGVRIRDCEEAMTDIADTALAFPLAGSICRVDYGFMVVEHDYRIPGRLAYRVLSGPVEGTSETVDLAVTPVRDDVFALDFRDSSGPVVLVLDLAAGSVAVLMVGGPETVRLTGKLTVVQRSDG